jgi:hypothetical protein
MNKGCASWSHPLTKHLVKSLTPSLHCSEVRTSLWLSANVYLAHSPCCCFQYKMDQGQYRKDWDVFFGRLHSRFVYWPGWLGNENCDVDSQSKSPTWQLPSCTLRRPKKVELSYFSLSVYRVCSIERDRTELTRCRIESCLFAKKPIRKQLVWNMQTVNTEEIKTI